MNDRPKFGISMILVAALIVVGAAGLYQANQKGLIHLPAAGNIQLPQTSSSETRTVVQEENAIITVVDKTSPSVVAVGEIQTQQQNTFNPFDPFSNQPGLGNDFGNGNDNGSSGTTTNNTIGTGFVVYDSGGKGIIVTNKHVVSDTSTGVKYTIVTKDAKKLDIQRIYRDPILDLAIVQVNADGLQPLEFGDSSKLKVGQTAIAIGNALGKFTNTVTTGIVSGLSRSLTAGDPFGASQESLDNLIQTDAAINPGNSGGPLLNSAGQVIGVNVATTQGAQNIGFAIPANSVKSIVDEFVNKGTVSRPFLGVRYRFITRDVALLNNVPQGAYVQDVVSGGPAEKAGVQADDIITKLNSQAIDSETKISDIIAKGTIGQKMTIEVWRDNKTVTLNATLEELPAQ